MNWAEAEKLRTVATAYAPVGPTADDLRVVAAAMKSRGIRFARVIRRWDALCWPHATKGFFPFKRNIPSILETF